MITPYYILYNKSYVLHIVVASSTRALIFYYTLKIANIFDVSKIPFPKF